MPNETLAKYPETVPAESIEFDVSRGNTLYLANGLQPIGIEPVDIGQAEPIDIQVFARVTTEEQHDHPSSSYVIGKVNNGPEEKFVAVRTSGGDSEEPEIIKLPGLNTAEGREDETVRLGEVNALTFTRDETKHKGWLGISLHNRPGTYAGAKVEVAEAAHPDLEWGYEVRDRKRSIKRWKRAGAVVLALAAFRGVTMPGGVQDRVLDPSHDSHEFVLDSLHSNPDDVPAEGLEADGVQFPKQEVLQWPEYAAAERVATTMGDLDGHRYEEVKDRAEAFVAANRGEILMADQLESIKARVDEANDIEQLEQAIKHFGTHFGVGIYVGQSEDLPKLKYMAHGVIDALGPLPSSLVKSAFSTGHGAINFSPERTDMEDDASAYGTAVASFSNDEIRLFSSGRVDLGPIEISLLDLKGNILHELGHGLQRGTLNLDNYTASDGSIGTRLEGVVSRIVSHPKFTSDYASSRPHEETSETIREVLQGNIADPDHVGEFESRANSLRLNILGQLEEKYPGVTDYLVTLNPGLLEN